MWLEAFWNVACLKLPPSPASAMLSTRNSMKAVSSAVVQIAAGAIVGIERVGGRWYGGVRARNVVHEVYNPQTRPRRRVSTCSRYLTIY